MRNKHSDKVVKPSNGLHLFRSLLLRCIAARNRDTVPDFRHVKSQGVTYWFADTIDVERELTDTSHACKMQAQYVPFVLLT